MLISPCMLISLCMLISQCVCLSLRVCLSLCVHTDGWCRGVQRFNKDHDIGHWGSKGVPSKGKYKRYHFPTLDIVGYYFQHGLIQQSLLFQQFSSYYSTILLMGFKHTLLPLHGLVVLFKNWYHLLESHSMSFANLVCNNCHSLTDQTAFPGVALVN